MAEANRRLAPLYLKGPGYEEFVAALTEIAYAACEQGAQTFQTLGKSLDDIPGDEELRRQFMAACHEGFDRAQAAIGQLIIELDAGITDAERDRAEARKNHDKEKAQDLALRSEGMTNRQLVLRRIVDYIYFALLNREAHRYKRFLVHRKLQNIDADVLRMALDIAKARNAENAFRFTLVADLTTGMHMADLVEIDRTDPEPRLDIIELKTGETNRVLLDMLTKRPDRATVDQLNAMGPKALEQLDRMMRQHRRLSDAFTVMTRDRGFDTLNQAPIVLSKDPVPVDGFFADLITVCVEADNAGVSDRRIDECLSLVAIREDCGLTITDGLVKHYFYHLDPETRHCLLLQGGDAAHEEMGRVAQSGVQFLDLGKFLLRDLFGPGLFATVPTPIALEIVTGKLRLFARFDIARFFALAATQGITLKWGSRRESAEAIRRKVSAPIPGASGRSSVVHYQIKDQPEGTLLYGFFIRPFRDLLRASDLVELIRARAAQPPAEDQARVSAEAE
jgi:hypothetical protein